VAAPDGCATITTHARAAVRLAALALAVHLAPGRPEAHEAALELRGAVQSQNLVRHPDVDEWHFVQQRNTLRLGLRWNALRDAESRGIDVGFLGDARLVLAYRGVYDSIYSYAPVFRERDLRGRKPGRAAERDLRDLSVDTRQALAFENHMREAYVDVTARAWPLRIRIGRQQVVWGEADLFRMLDRANPLDTSWHFGEEIPPPAFGWDDLRIPLWMVRGWLALGAIGPASDVRTEAYWNVGAWRPIQVAFLPRPWGIRLLNPLTNREDGAFFAPFAGIHRLYHSRLFEQGDYSRNPGENSQVGWQLSARFSGDLRAAIYYFHQRWADDDGTPAAVIQGLPDTPSGRDLTQELLLRGTLPVRYVTPYIHTLGASSSAYAPALQTTLRLETVYDFGLPIFNRDRHTTFSPLLPGVSHRDYWKSMVAFDRPLALRWVNDGAAVFLSGQWFVHHLIQHKDSFTGPLDLPTAGARSRPFCGSARDHPCTDPRGNGSFRDDVHSWESLVTLAAFTTYRRGTVTPVAAFILDPVNSWSMHLCWSVELVVSPTVSVDLTQRYFVSMQRDVQKGPFDPWLFGTMRGRSETGLRLTYRF